MKLPPEGARWLVSLRWWACAVLLATIWCSSTGVGMLTGQRLLVNPLPLYAVAGGVMLYNVVFRLSQRRWSAGEGNVDRNIRAQIVCDLAALTLLLYFADLPRNPFLFYFAFHMIVAGMYLRGRRRSTSPPWPPAWSGWCCSWSTSAGSRRIRSSFLRTPPPGSVR